MLCLVKGKVLRKEKTLRACLFIILENCFFLEKQG